MTDQDQERYDKAIAAINTWGQSMRCFAVIDPLLMNKAARQIEAYVAACAAASADILRTAKDAPTR